MKRRTVRKRNMVVERGRRRGWIILGGIMNKEYLEKIEVSAINLRVSVSELVNEIIRLQSHLRRSNDLLSEGLSIVQEYSPGHDIFISEALQHLGLEEQWKS